MTIKRRGARMVAMGLALMGVLFGFAATPALALSISGTYTDIAIGSLGTEGAAGVNITGFLPNLVQTSLSGGFPVAAATANGTTYMGNSFWNGGSGVSADPIGTRTDNLTGLDLNFPSNFFASGESDNSAKFLAVHWSAAFSNSGPAQFSLQADDHAFLFIDGQLLVDDGGIKDINAPSSLQTGTLNATGNHTLDLFFADAFRVQSGIIFSCDGCQDPTSTVPEPATLLLFGSTLVGLGSVVRRRLKRQNDLEA